MDEPLFNIDRRCILLPKKYEFFSIPRKKSNNRDPLIYKIKVPWKHWRGSQRINSLEQQKISTHIQKKLKIVFPKKLRVTCTLRFFNQLATEINYNSKQVCPIAIKHYGPSLFYVLNVNNSFFIDCSVKNVLLYLTFLFYY